MNDLRTAAARSGIKLWNKSRKKKAVAEVQQQSSSGIGIKPSLDFNDFKTLANAGFLSQHGFINSPSPQLSNFDGNKFYGGFGPSQVFVTNYWELRAKSNQLFKENLYARGLIRREVGRNLRLRYVPDMEFFFDDSLGNAEHIESLLRQIRDSET